LLCFFRWLAENGNDPAKKLIMNGTEILSMESCGVTLKDSKCFMPLPLSRLPKTFGLKELAKGFFPYIFDVPAHDDYVGPWPAAHYYQPDTMKPEGREQFYKWYETVKDKVNISCPFCSCYLLFIVGV
jgi:hypothetical protein